MQAFVDRFRAKATKARAGAVAPEDARQARADRGDRRRATCAVHLPRPAKALSPPIIALEGVSVGYERHSRCCAASPCRIDDDDRIALLGANGNGKSTFAKLLAGRLDADGRRRCARADELEVGYFAQHQIDELDAERQRRRARRAR